MRIKKIFDRYFLMSKSERSGLNVLLVILLLVMVMRFLMPMFISEKPDDVEKMAQKMAQLEQEMKKLQQADKNEKVNSRKTQSYSRQSKNYKPKYSAQNYRNNSNDDEEKVEPEYFEFDPNIIDQEGLKRLGFTKRQAQTFVNYREKGGRFYKASDLSKVYGVDSLLVSKLLPYVAIEEKKKSAVDDIKIELNKADSSALVSLRGIGPAYASRIIKYRSILGGFSHVEQLKEIYNFPEETYDAIAGHITVEPNYVKKINVNFASVADLGAHPYIRRELARKIVDYRAEKGAFSDVEQLKIDSVIPVENFQKLLPYLTVR